MRHARIKRLKQQLLPDRDEDPDRQSKLDAPYFIGKSQKLAVNLTGLLWDNQDDIATSVRDIAALFPSVMPDTSPRNS